MRNRFRDRFRERTLDAMDWVDIRPDPHWSSFIVAPLVLGLSLYYIPPGFLPLFLSLCALAALACLLLVVVGVVGTILWRALRDVGAIQLEAARKAVREASTARGTGRSPV